MEIGEQCLSAAQACDLHRLWFLDLHDEVGAGKGGVRVRHDCRTGRAVVVVAAADALAGALFDEHAVAALREFAHGGRHKTDTIFVVLDFRRNADPHGLTPWGVFAS